MLNYITSFFIQDIYCYTQVIVNQVYTPVSLLLYAHIPTAIITLIAGIFLLTKNKKLETKIFFFLTLAFFLFTMGDLIEWFAFLGRDAVMFSRSLIELLDPILFILSSYFLFVLIKKRDINLVYKIIWLIPLIPLIVRALIGLNLIGYNWQICEVVESDFSMNYIYYIDLFYMISAIIFSIWSIIIEKKNRKETTIASIGVCTFIVGFFVMEYIFTGYILGGVFNYNYFLYAFFGMPILIGFLAYLIVKYKVFNVKLISAQVLIFSLIALIGAQFFFIQTTINFILNGVTFIGVVIFGIFLIESVKKEVRQKEYLEKLTIELNDSKMRLEDTNIKLESANDKLQSLDKLKTEFLSLASHQLRSPLTAITGYTSMLLDGSFGKMDDKQKEAIDRVYQSSRHLSTTVEDLLNVTKIEQGGMQYVMADFDFEKAAQDLAKDLSVTAEKKGLKLTFKTDKKSPYTVKGDMEKIRQVILNFIDNSIKYTKKGSIHVLISKDEDKKKIRLSITDTGMGMTPEIKAKLFQKFSRAEGAKMNAGGSGLGLYLAKKIIEEGHHGAVGVDSDGTDLGSTFWMELDSI